MLTGPFWRGSAVTGAVRLAETTCLWYGSFRTRTVRVTLLRDEGADTGYDLALATID
ncbi:hypothetical protein ACFC09_32420 [Streptomyces sp. NPDC056161]|uniref:hypothetical protein n=1 Tax=Streptomyces sp. NPDC056161 TaxID=3345732 RepID=UPI0035E39AAD